MALRKYGTGSDQQVTDVEPPPADEDVITVTGLRGSNPGQWSEDDERGLQEETGD